MLSSDPIN